jgi:RNase P protein component
MLSARKRLGKSEIRSVMSGYSVRGDFGQIRVVRMANGPKAAVVVPRKAAASAVERNYIRRIAYETLRTSDFETYSVGIVWYPTKQIIGTPAPQRIQQINDILAQVWSKLGR